MLTVAFINVLWTIGKIASKYIPVKMKTQQSSLATDTVEKFLQKPLLLCTFQSMHFKTVTLAAFLKKSRFIFLVLWCGPSMKANKKALFPKVLQTETLAQAIS